MEPVSETLAQEKATLRQAARALRKTLDLTSISQEVREQLILLGP